MVAEAEVLDELIDDLLEAGRTMTGASPLPEEPVRLDRVVAQVVEKWGRTNASLVCDLTPVTVVGSPRLLRRGVINLVRNAERHAYSGGPGTIVISVDGRGVSVRDDGPGVTPGRLALLRREHSVVVPRGRCAVVGLSLARWTAEVHGGHLQLDNRAEGGFEASMVLGTIDGEVER